MKDFWNKRWIKVAFIAGIIFFFIGIFLFSGLTIYEFAKVKDSHIRILEQAINSDKKSDSLKQVIITNQDSIKKNEDTLKGIFFGPHKSCKSCH